MQDPKTLRAIARRMNHAALLRETMFPNPGPTLAGRLSEIRDWASMLSNEARAIERKAKLRRSKGLK